MLWLGIGCKRDTDKDFMLESLAQLVQESGLKISDFMGTATLDTKAQEPGIITVCKTHHLKLKMFSAHRLARVSVPNPSDQVGHKIPTTSVAEAAAILAAIEPINFSKHVDINATPTTTLETILVVPKTIFKRQYLDTWHCVTFAVGKSYIL